MSPTGMTEPASPPAVLQIVPSLDAGGAERTTIDIAKALTAAGLRALVASEGGRLEGELRDAGGELIRLAVASKNPAVMLKNAASLANIIRERNVSLIHARSRAPAWSAALAARRTHIPFVTTYHGIYNAKGPLKRLYNSVMARGDAVIANSEWTARHVRETYPFATDRIAVIPRGLDLDRFDTAHVAPERIGALRDRWGVGSAERVVFLPGRLTRWKGHLVFIEALSRMKQAGRLSSSVRAVIAGDAQGRTGYRDELIAAAAEASLADVVILSGHVTDMPAAYLAADIVVSASTDPEAFGRVVPEAAAMGRPVIATNHGGARETVLAGESGLLVEPNDAAALADALADLLLRPMAGRLDMGAKGRAHIEARFSVERMCAETLALYRTLMARGRPRSS
jgi:glycosyltransferase involved in cell wall biosynthesis